MPKINPTILLTKLFLVFLIPVNIFAQIKGKVKDNYGNPMAFANVYFEGTTIGTTTNDKGEYYITPPNEGEHILVFQYMGYQREKVSVNWRSNLKIINVELKENKALLKEVIVRPGEEDPAYEIIRNAIAKRKYYKNNKLHNLLC